MLQKGFCLESTTNLDDIFGFLITEPIVAHSLPFPKRRLAMKKTFKPITILAAAAAPASVNTAIDIKNNERA
jgi:hypothetical protein